MVKTFSVLGAGRLGVVSIWGGVIKLIASLFMAALLFPSLERGKRQFVPNQMALPFISFV